jgi:hypothetical protein
VFIYKCNSAWEIRCLLVVCRSNEMVFLLFSTWSKTNI